MFKSSYPHQNKAGTKRCLFCFGADNWLAEIPHANGEMEARLLLQRRNRAKRDLFNCPLTRTKKLMVLHARFAGSRLKSWWLFTRCNIFFGRIRGLVWRSLRRVRSSIPPRYSLREISTSLRMTYSSFVKLYLSEMGDTAFLFINKKRKTPAACGYDWLL